MQSFGAETVEAFGRPPRTTALAISALPGAADEGQVPKWTGRSPRKPPQAAVGRQRQFDVVSSGRSTGLWHRQGSSGCFRDFDPASGRRPMSAVPRKPDGGDAIFLLSVRPVVAGSARSWPRQEAAVRREGLFMPRSASSDDAECTLTARSGCSRPSGIGAFIAAIDGYDERRRGWIAAVYRAVTTAQAPRSCARAAGA
jgi:hypothetical protein